MIVGRVRMALTGGDATALDGISATELETGYIALAFYGGVFSWFVYDAEGTDEELVPDIIRPDDYVDGGNWVRQTNDYAVLGTMPAGVDLQGQIIGLDCAPDDDSDHDVSVAIGACLDSTGSAALKLSAAMVKRIDADWVAGSGNGGMLNGAVAANTLYRFYALLKADDATVDFGWLAAADDIADYLPAGYSHYRALRFYLTDASANLCQTTQRGDYISHFKASDWVVTAGVTNAYAAVDHSAFLVEELVELIEYGVRDASVDGYCMYASEDGTNVSFLLGRPRSTTSNASIDTWGTTSTQKASLKPYNPARLFRTESGTMDLLIQAIKMRR